jgi:glucose/arabinose dehydrogenase
MKRLALLLIAILLVPAFSARAQTPAPSTPIPLATPAPTPPRPITLPPTVVPAANVAADLPILAQMISLPPGVTAAQIIRIMITFAPDGSARVFLTYTP